MTTNLRDKLLETAPRERSGPISFNRFTYQNSWALCHLLSLHESGKDYLIAFDFHDDVLVLNSPVSPDKAKFYQIKTKRSGNWTCNKLTQKKTSSKKSTEFSYLGKLYHHVLTFPGSVEALFFVSNAPFKMQLKSREDSLKLDKVEFKYVAEDTKKDISLRLQKEHCLKSLPTDIDFFCLEVTTLSLDGHYTHCLGQVADFLTKHLKKQNIPAKPFHNALVGEITRRASCEFDFTSWSDFCERRTLYKESFQSLLSHIQAQTNFKDIEQTMLDRLDHEGISFLERESIRKSLIDCEVDLMNNTNLLIKKAKENIHKLISDIKEKNPIHFKKLRDLLGQVVCSKNQHIIRLKSIKGESYIKALSLVCIYED